MSNAETPAMPQEADLFCDRAGECSVDGTGLSKREHFAALAMNGLLAGGIVSRDDLCEEAWATADCMLEGQPFGAATTRNGVNSMSNSMQIYMIMDLSIGVIDSKRLTLEEALKMLQESEDYAIMLQPDKDVNPSLRCDFCNSNYATLRDERNL